MSEHIASLRLYVGVLLALLVLTAVTVSVAFLDLGAGNTIVALLIAASKAFLVLLYFMHLRHSKHLTWVVALVGFFWLGILLILTFGDYETRGWTQTTAARLEWTTD